MAIKKPEYINDLLAVESTSDAAEHQVHDLSNQLRPKVAAVLNVSETEVGKKNFDHWQLALLAAINPKPIDGSDFSMEDDSQEETMFPVQGDNCIRLIGDDELDDDELGDVEYVDENYVVDEDDQNVVFFKKIPEGGAIAIVADFVHELEFVCVLQNEESTLAKFVFESGDDGTLNCYHRDVHKELQNSGLGSQFLQYLEHVFSTLKQANLVQAHAFRIDASQVHVIKWALKNGYNFVSHEERELYESIMSGSNDDYVADAEAHNFGRAKPMSDFIVHKTVLDTIAKRGKVGYKLAKHFHLYKEI